MFLAYSKKYFHPGSLLFFLAVAALFALALHIVIPHHHHPDELFGSGMQAAHHGEERRWWAALLAMAFIAQSAVVFRLLLAIMAYGRSVFHAAKRVCAAKADSAKIFDPVRMGLRCGIVHSRLFSERSHKMGFFAGDY